MISKREYFKRNRYGLLIRLSALLSLVALIHGIWTEDTRSFIGFGIMLGIGSIVQWSGEGAYQRYVDAVNKNPNDDLK